MNGQQAKWPPGHVCLAMALKIAGADEIMGSLRNVEDSITAGLMSVFMRSYVKAVRCMHCDLR